MLRLVAYISVSHFGLITLGIFAFTSQGQTGATLYMVNHGFSTGALLLVIGFMISRRKSRGINDFGGMQKVTPILAGTFLVACLSGSRAARAEHVRQRIPRAGRHVHPLQGGRDLRHRGHRAGRALHADPVPAHDDRARFHQTSRAAAICRFARSGSSRRWWRSSSCSASTHGRFSTRSPRRSARRLHQTGNTDPAPDGAAVAATPPASQEAREARS